MAIVRQGLTLEEFLALPEEKPALEYCEGVVTQKVAPSYEHSALQSQIIWELRWQLDARGIAVVLPELRSVYPERAYVPDVAVYRRERLPRRLPRQRIGELRIPPDLAVEIISPGQTLHELQAKCSRYVDLGVQVALLVDDRDETIRAFRPNTRPTIHHRGQRVALDEVAPGLHLDVDRIFDALDTD
jgi:Uma2 family endonuclease